jgi:hypothetical protein
MLGACAATLTGIVLLIRMPVPMAFRLLALALWLGSCVVEIGRLSRGAQRTRMLVLSADGASIINRHGRREPVRIMSGSVVLPRLAWLYLELPDGLAYGELFRGDARTCRTWRHLQILWRQGSGTFGGQV